MSMVASTVGSTVQQMCACGRTLCYTEAPTFTLRLGGGGLVLGGHSKGTLGTVAAHTEASLPLALGARCHLTRCLQVVTSRDDCRTAQESWDQHR